MDANRWSHAAIVISLVAASGAAQAALPIDYTFGHLGVTFNPGPFPPGGVIADVGPVSAAFQVDATVPVSTTFANTWVNALDNLVLQIGSFTINATDGWYSQIVLGDGTQVYTGAWNAAAYPGSSITPFQVTNPVISPDPFTLVQIDFEIRTSNPDGTPFNVFPAIDQLPNQPRVLPFCAPQALCNFQRLNLFFTHPTINSLPNVTILTGFSSATITPVPEPATPLMLLGGLGALALLRRRGCHRAA